MNFVTKLSFVLVGSLISAFSVAEAQSQKLPTPESVRLKLEEKLQELRKPQDDLESGYESALEKLETKLQGEGKLDEVLKIRTEIESFRDPNKSFPEAYESIEELQRLRNKYVEAYWRLRDQNRLQQIKLLNAYLEFLQKYRTKLTKEGSVDAAILLDDEIDRASGILVKLDAMQRWKGPGQFERLVLWEYRNMLDMEPATEVKIVDGPRGQIQLHSIPGQAKCWIRTKEYFTPPFRLTASAMTNSTDLRFFYGQDEFVIFNWSSNPDDLRIADPSTGRGAISIEGKGRIAPNEMHDLEVRITENRISVYVDGALRGSRRGDFGDINSQIGIGPALGSVVTFEAIAVFGKE